MLQRTSMVQITSKKILHGLLTIRLPSWIGIVSLSVVVMRRPTAVARGPHIAHIARSQIPRARRTIGVLSVFVWTAVTVHRRRVHYGLQLRSTRHRSHVSRLVAKTVYRFMQESFNRSWTISFGERSRIRRMIETQIYYKNTIVIECKVKLSPSIPDRRAEVGRVRWEGGLLWRRNRRLRAWNYCFSQKMTKSC